MSPILFDVFIDDLLDELQTRKLTAITEALDRLVASTYADDLKAVSGTHGMQRIIAVIKRHSENGWDVNI
jgi:hypothetical protein